MECMLCKCTNDDPIVLGEKYTCKDVTVHYFCLLLSSNLMQHGDDDEGILGFMPNDIKAEAKRANALFCCFCKKRGAHVGCCETKCKKSFHFWCAVNEDCRFEFSDTFQSFCPNHHAIEQPEKVHAPTDTCAICSDEMGTYNPIQSIQSPCCNKDSWYHKLCLLKFAKSSGYFLKCPLCNDTDYFRQEIQLKGIFIPDKDADWEETGPNSFYDFQEHSIRPNTCSAKVCKSRRGRDYSEDDESSRYFLLYCDCCGSSAAHQSCCNDSIFLCEICDAMEGSKINNTSDNGFDETASANSHASNSSSEGEAIQRDSRNRRRAINRNRPRRSNNSRASSSRSNVSNTLDNDDSSGDEFATVSVETTTTTTVRITQYSQLIRPVSVLLSPLHERYPNILISPLQKRYMNLMNASKQKNETEDENDTKSHTEDEDSDIENQKLRRVKKRLQRLISSSEENESEGPIVMRKIAQTAKRNPLSDSDESNNNLCSSGLEAKIQSLKDMKPIREEDNDDTEEDDQKIPVKVSNRPRELSSTSSNDEIQPVSLNPTNNRKRKSYVDFFGLTSSDESGADVKQPNKKRFKAAKFKQLQRQRIAVRPPNQRTILEMFQTQLNRS